MGKKSKRNKQPRNAAAPAAAPAAPFAAPFAAPPAAPPAAPLQTATLPSFTFHADITLLPPEDAPPGTEPILIERQRLLGGIISPTTRLAHDGYCVACGAEGANHLCQCGQVSYCDERCSKKGWPKHRLNCPKKTGKQRKKDSKFLSGDIVKIQGLTNETEMEWNGCLAEIRSYDKETQCYAILFSTNIPYEVKSAKMKRENLELYLTIEDAARAAHERDKPRYDPYVRVTAAQKRKTMQHLKNPRKFIQQLENNEIDDIVALHVLREHLEDQPQNNTFELCMNLMEHGLVNVLMKIFVFPLALDAPVEEIDQGRNIRRAEIAPAILSECIRQMMFNKDSAASTFANAGLAKDSWDTLAPFILLVCSKKRRLFGSVDCWCFGQVQFLLFLYFSASVRLVLDGEIRSMPEECLGTLMEHLVLLATVDIKKFLQNSSCVLGCADSGNKYKTVVVILMHIFSAPSPSKFQKLGLIPVPFGAQTYVGQSFASVAPKAFAKLFLGANFSDPNLDRLPMAISNVLRGFAATSSLDAVTTEANGYVPEIMNLDHSNSFEECAVRAKDFLESVEDAGELSRSVEDDESVAEESVEDETVE